SRQSPVNPDKAARILDREGFKQYAVNEAEDETVGADRKGQGQNRDDRKSRSPSEHPQRITNILEYPFDCGPDPYAASILPGKSRISHAAIGRPPGFAWRHAPIFKIALTHRAMEFHFLVEFSAQPAPIDPVPQTAQKLAHAVSRTF